MSNPIIGTETIGKSDAGFSRSEFTILRAWIQGLPLNVINSHYGVATNSSIKKLAGRAADRLDLAKKWRAAQAVVLGPNQADEGQKLALNALSDLQLEARKPPSPTDHCSEWFMNVLSKRLESNNIQLLSDLFELMNGRGAGWWRGCPGIGKKAGDALTRWVSKHQNEFDFEFKEFISAPALPALYGDDKVLVFPGTPRLVPFEHIKVKSDLDGSRGRNRGELARCRMSANNDYEALHTWLSLYPTDSHTYTAYRKEAERFLLWAIVEKGKALSDLYIEDCIEYFGFLKDPSPKLRWIGPATTRKSPNWRPFACGLAPSSCKLSATILKALFTWLTRQHYLDYNPFDAMPRSKIKAKILVEKALNTEAWDTFVEWLTQQHSDTSKTALAACLLMGDNGLRRTEVINLKRENLSFTKGSWEASFVGKGDRKRVIPISLRTINALNSHLATRNLSLDTMKCEIALLAPKNYVINNEETVKRRKTGAGYSSEGIYRLIKATFSRFHAAHGDIDGRDLSKMFPHALRHTCGVQMASSGVAPDVMQQVLGHTSLATTTIYLQGDLERRKLEMEKLHGKYA
jgi:site-specific recombinase XerD